MRCNYVVVQQLLDSWPITSIDLMGSNLKMRAFENSSRFFRASLLHVNVAFRVVNNKANVLPFDMATNGMKMKTSKNATTITTTNRYVMVSARVYLSICAVWNDIATFKQTADFYADVKENEY